MFGLSLFAARTPCIMETYPFSVDNIIPPQPVPTEDRLNMMPLTSDIYEDFVDEVELINKPADKTAYVLVISDLNVQQVIVTPF